MFWRVERIFIVRSFHVFLTICLNIVQATTGSVFRQSEFCHKHTHTHTQTRARAQTHVRLKRYVCWFSRYTPPHHVHGIFQKNFPKKKAGALPTLHIRWTPVPSQPPEIITDMPRRNVITCIAHTTIQPPAASFYTTDNASNFNPQIERSAFSVRRGRRWCEVTVQVLRHQRSPCLWKRREFASLPPLCRKVPSLLFSHSCVSV